MRLTGKLQLVIFSMTSGAQQALRRIMEIYSGTTRFALACNISSKIIEPIQSRCAIVRFGKLSDEQIFSRIKDIAKLEQAEVTIEGLEAVVFTADGDMRQAINNLQSTVAGFGLVIPENVYKICDLPNPGHVEKILELISQGQMENAFVGLRLLYEKGFSASDIVSAFFKVLKYTNKFAENVQLGMMREVGMTQLRVVEGSNSLLQLCAMLAKMIPA